MKDLSVKGRNISVPRFSLALTVIATTLEQQALQLINAGAPQLAATLLREDVDDIENVKISLITASFILGQFLSSAILGGLSDRYGRKPILIGCLLCSSGFSTALALSVDYWIFIIFRLLQGMSNGSRSVVIAYISDVARPSDMPFYTMILMGAINVGGVLDPTLGGFLYRYVSNSSPFIVLAVANFLAALLSFCYLIEPTVLQEISINKSTKSSSNSSPSLMSPTLWCAIFFISVGGGCITFQIFSCLAVFPAILSEINGFEPDSIGLVISSFLGLALIFNVFVFYPFSKRFPLVGVAAVFLLLPVFLIIVPVIEARSFYVLTGFGYLTFMAGGVIPCAVPVILRSICPPKHRGKINGLNLSAWTFFGGCGPLVVSYVWERGYGHYSYFYCLPVVSGVGSLCFMIVSVFIYRCPWLLIDEILPSPSTLETDSLDAIFDG